MTRIDLRIDPELTSKPTSQTGPETGPEMAPDDPQTLISRPQSYGRVEMTLI